MARVITGRPTSAAAAAARPLRLATQLQQTLITPLLLQARSGRLLFRAAWVFDWPEVTAQFHKHSPNK